MELDTLNPQQEKAVHHDQGPLLVVAGAGTGKTRVITRRIAELVTSKKARPEEILALTFTDKAAREMEERVDQLLPYGMVDTQIMTFHAFGDLLLKQYAADIGLDAAFQVMSKSQQIIFLKQNFDQFNFEYFAPIGSPDRYLNDLINYFSRLKEELISPAAYLSYTRALKAKASDEAQNLEVAKHQELARAYDSYIALSRKAGLLDFGDQIALVVELFEKRPNILKQLRSQIKYILVDEFQDTNLAQNRFLELLVGGSKGNIMVVGDDDQSIYKFRGAAISNILNFSTHFKSAQQVVLTKNYRSTQEILDSAYRLIQNNNPDRLEVRNKIDKQLKAQESGPLPQLITSATYSLEADAVASDIKARLKAGESGDSIAVLVRKRSQAEVVIQALQAQNVPYRLSGRQSLYRQPEVELVFDFLRATTDPTDSMSLYHLLTGEAFRFELPPLMRSAANARKRNLALEDQLNLSSDQDESFNSKIAAFMEHLQRWRQLSTHATVGELVFDFLQTSGYLDSLTEESKTNPGLEIKIRNLSRFFNLLGEYERVADDTSALAYITMAEALRQAGDEPDASESDINESEVQVMTIHKAKGLEFDTVYIFDLTKGGFPAIRRRETLEIPLELLGSEVMPEGDWHLQEERRLMYVAITRAKRNLILSWSPDHGGLRSKTPSPFIAEALGIEVPKLEVEQSLSSLQQIKLFELKEPDNSSLKPAFMSGETLQLTPHQIDDYLTCPENFRYLYILQVPQAPKPTLMYGSLIHNIINHYYLQKRSGKPDLNQLQAMIETLWRSEGFISKGQEQRRLTQAHQTVKKFFEREAKAKEAPAYNEREFQVEIPEHKVIVRGRFDAVYVRPHDQVEIRDYKTSLVEEVGKADDKAKSSVQLSIYALAWQRLTGKIPTSVVLDFVETGQQGVAIKTEADLAQTVADIGKVAEGIRAGNFAAGKSCFYCSHRKVTVEV